MITKISEQIASFILKNSNNSSKEFKDIYKYGTEIFISSFLNIFLILIIGIVSKTLIQSIVFLLCFVPLRQFTGGWHANTYLKCNLIFCISYILIVILSAWFYNIENIYLIFFMIIFGFIPILIFCPVENKNKKVKRKNKLKFLSIVLYIIFSSASILFYYYNKDISFTLLFTLLCVSVSVIAGCISKLRP